MDGVNQIAGGGLFEQVTGGSRLQRLEEILLVVMHRQNQHLNLFVPLPDLPGGIHAIHDRHANVHKHYVRNQLLYLLESLVPVFRLPYHFHSTHFAKQADQPRAEYRVVVGYQYSYILHWIPSPGSMVPFKC